MTIPGAQPEADAPESSVPALSAPGLCEPGLCDPDLCDPDLRVTLEPVAADTAVRADGPYTLLDDGSLIFTMPGVARYRIAAGAGHIAIHAEDGAPGDDVCAMLVATALPCWLWMRGDVVLHAAAAVPHAAPHEVSRPASRQPGRAVALTGASGAGKSTGLRRLLVQGASVLADDTVRLWRDGNEVRAAGLPAALQMRAPSAAAGGAPVRRWLEVPAESQCRSATLGSILLLGGPHSAGSPPVRLAGAAALVALRRNLHRATAARLLGREPGLLPSLAAMLRTVEVFREGEA